MDLLQLRYFQAIARQEHMSRAARELRVSQPSLSRAIARLEAEVGVALFDREGRQIRLNQNGTSFLSRVDRAMRELEQGQRELADAEGVSPPVTIASETLLTLTGVLKSFLASRPEVSVRLVQQNAEHMVRALLVGDVDLCLASQPIGGPPLVAEELRTEDVFLVVPHSHRLAALASVRIEDVAHEPLVVTGPGYWQRTLTDRLFAERGLRPLIACEGNEPTATLSLIEAGLGVGLMPDLGRLRNEHRSVAWLTVEGATCVRVLSLAWNDDVPLSPAAERFRDFALEFFRMPGPTA